MNDDNYAQAPFRPSRTAFARRPSAYDTPNVYSGPNAPGPTRVPMGGPNGRGLVAPVVVPDKWITWPGLVSLDADVAGGLSGDLSLTFREPGLVCGMLLGAQGLNQSDQILAASQLGLQCAIQPSTEALFTDGTAEAYVPFLGLTGGQLTPIYLMRRVERMDQWTLRLRNLSSTAYTPIVTLWFRRDLRDDDNT